MSSLRVRLALLVMAAAVPALLFVLFNFIEQRRETTADAYGNALRVARAVAADQDQLIESTRQFLTAMALHPQVRSLDGKICSALAAKLLSPIFANIGVATPDGNIFCSALPLEGPVNNADRAYFIRAMESRKFAIGDFQIGRITHLPTINAGYPVLDQAGRIVAVAFAALDLRQISESLAKTDLPNGSTVTVIDAYATVLARFPDAQQWVGKTVDESPIFKALLSTKGEGTAQTAGLDGVRRLYGFATLPSPSGAGAIYVSVGIPTAVAFGPATRQLLHFGIAIGIVALAMLVITLVTSNGLILRPIDALVQAATRLSKGDLAARTGEKVRTGELGQLARVFDEMAETLQRRDIERRQTEQALRSSEEKFSKAFVASPDAVSITRLQDGLMVDVNPAAERLFGYTRAELIGKTSLALGLFDDPADRERFAGLVREQGHVRDYELRLRKGAEVRDVLVSADQIDIAGTSHLLSIVRDITAQKRAEQDRLAKEAAEAANRAKSEFLSRMSHELRTPLNAIIGFGQLMEMDAVTPEQRESVDQILRAGRHLLNLINEILDIARIEAGRLSLSIEPVALQEIVEECQDLIRPSAAQRRIVLDLQTGVDSQIVMADRQRLKQVLLNLLSNAVKFNSEGGRVTLSCTSRPQDRLRLGVTDTGPGISPESLRKLFTPFERLGAGQLGIEGTGLGLALSKTLTEAMQGVMGVESLVGRGSTFWIELPVARDVAPEANVREPAAAADGPTAIARAARTVLYIEDNLSNLKLLERVMARRPDVRLLTAMQGRLGLDLARQHRPDLILLDLDLPDVRGDQILRTLRDDAATGDIPVVMLTATATPGEIDRLLNSGARAYLTKPFDVKALFSLLDEIVAA
ncbi:MAG: ATP-binding protein [bacterium]